MALSLGSLIGPYEVRALLGAGGMGEVYRARDPRLGRDVAIKVLPAQFAEESRSRAAPGAGSPRDRGAEPSTYLPDSRCRAGLSRCSSTSRGRRSPDRWRQQRPYDWRCKLPRPYRSRTRKGSCTATSNPQTSSSHETAAQRCWTSGWRRSWPRTGDVTRTSEGTVAGTAAYMSPEQLEGRELDARSDISSGLVLYEILSGARAFGGDTVAQVLRAVLRDDPPPLRTLPALERIVNGVSQRTRRDGIRRWARSLRRWRRAAQSRL